MMLDAFSLEHSVNKYFSAFTTLTVQELVNRYNHRKCINADDSHLVEI